MMPDTRDGATQEREAELRQRLREHRYELRRSPEHPAYGGYMIVDAQRHVVVAGYEPFAFSLDLNGTGCGHFKCNRGAKP